MVDEAVTADELSGVDLRGRVGHGGESGSKNGERDLHYRRGRLKRVRSDKAAC